MGTYYYALAHRGYRGIAIGFGLGRRSPIDTFLGLTYADEHSEIYI